MERKKAKIEKIKYEIKIKPCVERIFYASTQGFFILLKMFDKTLEKMGKEN